MLCRSSWLNLLRKNCWCLWWLELILVVCSVLGVLPWPRFHRKEFTVTVTLARPIVEDDSVKRCALGGFYCGVGRTGGQLSGEPTEVRRTNEFPSVLLTHQSLSRRKADGNKSFGRSGTCRRPTGRDGRTLVGSDESEREGTTLSISKLERVGTSCRAFILQGVR